MFWVKECLRRKSAEERAPGNGGEGKGKGRGLAIDRWDPGVEAMMSRWSQVGKGRGEVGM